MLSFQQFLRTFSFFDNDKNLIPFTEQQIQTLKERILMQNFEITKEDKKGITFKNDGCCSIAYSTFSTICSIVSFS